MTRPPDIVFLNSKKDIYLDYTTARDLNYINLGLLCMFVKKFIKCAKDNKINTTKPISSSLHASPIILAQ